MRGRKREKEERERRKKERTIVESRKGGRSKGKEIMKPNKRERKG